MEEETNLIYELVNAKILIDTKQRFTQQEQVQLYKLYNLITGENKAPNGCSACLNNTISRIKKECRAHGI